MDQMLDGVVLGASSRAGLETKGHARMLSSSSASQMLIALCHDRFCDTKSSKYDFKKYFCVVMAQLLHNFSFRCSIARCENSH